MKLPVAPEEFSKRLKKGVEATRYAEFYLKHLHHSIEPVQLAASMELDFDNRERHRGPDLNCTKCGLSFEVRSSFLGVTMGHSEHRPFWAGKPADCIILHVNRETKEVTAISLADLVKTKDLALPRLDNERQHPYLFWPWEAINPIKVKLTPCPKWSPPLEDFC